MEGLHLTADLHDCRCDASLLTDAKRLAELCSAMTATTGLTAVADRWHSFPSHQGQPGGVTGMLLLAESHLTVHTFPEHRSLCLNLFCCTPRPAWPFAERLAEAVGAARVSVRHLAREYGSMVSATQH
jgi:spermidine synthase